MVRNKENQRLKLFALVAQYLALTLFLVKGLDAPQVSPNYAFNITNLDF